MSVINQIANTNDNGISSQTASGYAATRDASSGNLGDPSSTDHYTTNLNNSGSTFTVSRYFFYFDISALPPSAIISEVTLSLKTGGDYTNTNGSSAVLVAATPADKNSIVGGDFDQVGSTSLGSQAYPGAGNTAFTITLNAAGLVALEAARASGFFIVALRASGDFNNVSPSGVELQVNINSANAASAGDRPTLNITYTKPGGGAALLMLV